MTATKSAGPRHQHRVLCVDDNELLVSLSAAVLRNEGYEVLTCSDPLQAASIARAEELDLAILDYEMPAVNGAQLAAFCKAANPDIKVILFSGSLDIPSRELAIADQFVQKSDGVEALLEVIDALLAQSKTQANPVLRVHNKDTEQ